MKRIVTVDFFLKQFDKTIKALESYKAARLEQMSKNRVKIAALDADNKWMQGEVDRATTAADKIKALVS